MSVCKMTLVLFESSCRMLKKTRNDRLYVRVWRGVAVCGSAEHTAARTERLSGKSAQSITNTQTFVHENLNQYFSAPEEFFFLNG